MKKQIYITILLAALAFTFASCAEKLLEPVDTRVVLNSANTYLAGDEVVFDFNGKSDYIYFYSGETGSEYKYRDRTVIAMEDLETCNLVITCQAQYGPAGALDIYVSKTFGGLSGNDAAADLAIMESIQGTMDGDKNIEGWEKLPYNESVSVAQRFDITDYADRFALAFHWNTPTNTQTQRTYRMNFALETKFRGYPELTMRGKGMEGMISISMNTGDDPKITDAYYKNNGNGTVRFNDENFDFLMQGVGANVLTYALDSWVVINPRTLNSITPDKGLAIKGSIDEVEQYSYVYTQPGTYTATFVLSNGNYQGLERKVQDVNFTVIDPVTVP